MMKRSTTRGRRPRRQTAIRLAAALLLAAGTGATIVFAGVPGERLAQAAVVEQEALARADVFHGRVEGLVGTGTAFLSDEGPAKLTYEGLMKFSDDIDPSYAPGPNYSGGGLYHLRKAVEQLVLFFALPAFLAIAFVLGVVKGEQAGDELTKLAMRIVVFGALMFAYPMWDAMLYHGVGIPLSEKLLSGSVRTSVANAMADATGNQALAQGLQNGDVISDIDAGADSYACQLMNDPNIQAESAWVEDLCEEDTEMAKALRRSNMMDVSGSTLTQEEIDAIMGPEPDDFGVSADELVYKLGKTFMGWLMTIQGLAIRIALWFVWLVVIITRAASLVLAPIALVFTLLPDGFSKSKKWFMAHAEVCLRPAAIGFGLLIFWAMQAAIVSVNTTGWTGIGLKIAMTIGLIYMMFFKTKSLSKIAAGDVTEVAGELGVAARNKTIQLGAMVAGGAAMGAGAVAGSGMAAGLGGKAAAMAQGKGFTGVVGRSMMSVAKGANSVKEKLGYGLEPENGALAKTARAGVRAAEGTAGGAAVLWKNRVREDQATNPAAIAKAISTGPFKDTRDAIVAGREKKAEKRHSEATDDGRKAAGETGQRLDQIGRIKEANGIGGKLAPRKGEQVDEVVRDGKFRLVDAEGRANSTPGLYDAEGYVAVKGLNKILGGLREGEQNEAKALLAQLVPALAARGGTLNLVPGTGKEGNGAALMLDADSAGAIQEAIAKDPHLRKALMDHAHTIFPKGKVPMVKGPAGPAPDVNSIMAKSTGAMAAVNAAASFAESREFELLRREGMVQYARRGGDVDQDSVLELAIRGMDPNKAAALSEAKDWKGLRNEGVRALRVTWYLSASEEERANAGLPTSHMSNGQVDMEVVEKIASDASIDAFAAPLAAEGSASAAAPEMLGRFREALSHVQRPFAQAAGRQVMADGESFGINRSVLAREGREEYRFEDGSIMQEMLRASGGDHRKAFAAAQEYAQKLIDKRKGLQDLEKACRTKEAKEQLMNQLIFLSDARVKALEEGK